MSQDGKSVELTRPLLPSEDGSLHTDPGLNVSVSAHEDTGV